MCLTSDAYYNKRWFSILGVSIKRNVYVNKLTQSIFCATCHRLFHTYIVFVLFAKIPNIFFNRIDSHTVIRCRQRSDKHTCMNQPLHYQSCVNNVADLCLLCFLKLVVYFLAVHCPAPPADGRRELPSSRMLFCSVNQAVQFPTQNCPLLFCRSFLPL